MTKLCILLVENDPHYRSAFAELLETTGGYDVLIAKSASQAHQLVRITTVHLIIMDLRLRDDADPKDKSGLKLAEDLNSVIPKLILTKYPTWEDVRQSLRLDTYKLPTTVDFLNKLEDTDVLLAAIERIISQHVSFDIDYKQLRQSILQAFSEGELQDLCFDLAVDYEQLEGHLSRDKVRELIKYFQRRGRIDLLLRACHEKRPYLLWPTIS